METETDKANSQWARLDPIEQKRIARRHFNGTCICYCERGKVIPGSRCSGRSCLIGNLGGWAADQASKLTSKMGSGR